MQQAEGSLCSKLKAPNPNPLNLELVYQLGEGGGGFLVLLSGFWGD